MTLSALGLFAGAILAIAISPGPTAVALVARVITYGCASVLPFTLALWLGEALWLTFTVLGLSLFLQQFGWAFLLMKWLGVLFLMALACRMWFSRHSCDAAPPAAEASPGKLFLAGLTVTFTNPKIIAFYLALLPAIIDFGQIAFRDWLLLTCTLIAVLAAIDLLYIVLAEFARRHVRAIGNSHLISRCSAVALGGAALMIALQ